MKIVDPRSRALVRPTRKVSIDNRAVFRRRPAERRGRAQGQRRGSVILEWGSWCTDSKAAARVAQRYRLGSLFCGPFRISLDPDGTVTAQALERLLRRAGIEAVGVELTSSPDLPHNLLPWSASDVHGTPLGGMLAFDFEFDRDRVEVVAELEVLDPDTG